VLDEAFHDRLEVSGLHVLCGWLTPLADPPSDRHEGVATAFWPTGATSPSGYPVYGGPATEYPASMRFELLPEACKMRTEVRFQVPADLCPNPDETWYLQCKAATATAAYADTLGVQSRTEVLDLQIGPMHGSTVIPVDLMESGWKHARGKVSDLTKVFLATSWPDGASPPAGEGVPLLAEECSTTQFSVKHTPDEFGHYVLRGKHWHKMCDFQITGLECTMVREAAGGGDEPTLTRVLNCLKQDGTTVTVPVCLDKLARRSISDRFTTADPDLRSSSKLTLAALTDLIAELPTPRPRARRRSASALSPTGTASTRTAYCLPTARRPPPSPRGGSTSTSRTSRRSSAWG